MAKTQTYSMEKILAVREVLQKLPVKEKEKTRAEVVEFLKTDLRKVVKQGHSLQEIQAILAEQGVTVSLSCMEAVLGQSGKGSVREKLESGSRQPRVRHTKPLETASENVIVIPETRSFTSTRQEEDEPSYFRLDVPDSEL